MRIGWGIFKRNVMLPKEFQKVTEVDFEWVEQQTVITEKIARFIGINRYKTGTSSFTITPVSGTKRFRDMVKKFGDDNLEIDRSVNNLDKSTRRMDIRYMLLLSHEGHIYRIEIGVFLVARFAKCTMARFDNQMQDICNVQVMTYLKMHYPFLWKIFGKCIELPVLETVERNIKERLKYYFEQEPYHIQGATIVCDHTQVHTVPDYEKKTVGDLLGLRKQEMIGEF